MLVGVAASVVPTLGGLDVHSLQGLWLPFVLLNVGCGLRVVGQVLTDFTQTAFPVAGVSGLLEVTGLALWGLHLWAIMDGGVPVETQAGPRSLEPGESIRGCHRVGAILDLYPHLLPVFVAHGFKPLENPFLRRILARFTTVSQACLRLDVDEAHLLRALNLATPGRGVEMLSLSILDRDTVGLEGPVSRLPDEPVLLRRELPGNGPMARGLGHGQRVLNADAVPGRDVEQGDLPGVVPAAACARPRAASRP
jgi:hypothetical protein